MARADFFTILLDSRCGFSALGALVRVRDGASGAQSLEVLCTLPHSPASLILEPRDRIVGVDAAPLCGGDATGGEAAGGAAEGLVRALAALGSLEERPPSRIVLTVMRMRSYEGNDVTPDDEVSGCEDGEGAALQERETAPSRAPRRAPPPPPASRTRGSSAPAPTEAVSTARPSRFVRLAWAEPDGEARFRALISGLMARKSLNRAALAAESGIHPSNVSHWIAGTSFSPASRVITLLVRWWALGGGSGGGGGGGGGGAAAVARGGRAGGSATGSSSAWLAGSPDGAPWTCVEGDTAALYEAIALQERAVGIEPPLAGELPLAALECARGAASAAAATAAAATAATAATAAAHASSGAPMRNAAGDAAVATSSSDGAAAPPSPGVARCPACGARALDAPRGEC
jgi:trimeric autotransporter adhesin